MYGYKVVLFFRKEILDKKMSYMLHLLIING